MNVSCSLYANTSCNFFNIAFCFLIIRFSSTKDLIEIIDIAKEKHLKLILGTFEVDCTGDTLDPMVEGMVKMMGVFAELERNMISERVTSGMRNAAAKGKVIGRPHTTVADIPQRFMKSYPLYEKHKINQSELARITGLNRGTVRKYVKQDWLCQPCLACILLITFPIFLRRKFPAENGSVPNPDGVPSISW